MIMTFLEKFLQYTFIRFCIVGSISSIIDMGLLYILVEFFGVAVIPAAVVGFFISSINGFVLNRKFTFKSSELKIKRQYLQYLFVSACGLLLTIVFMKLFIDYAHLWYMFAKMLTIFIVLFWNFTINFLFVFSSKVTPDDTIQNA